MRSELSDDGRTREKQDNIVDKVFRALSVFRSAHVLAQLFTEPFVIFFPSCTAITIIMVITMRSEFIIHSVALRPPREEENVYVIL